MFRVIDNEIEMIRGDSAVFKFELYGADGRPIDLSSFNGEILFTVKVSVYADQAILQKRVVDGQVVIDPADTASLSCGRYVYDVQVLMTTGYTDTVIPPSTFRLLKEVTF